MASHRSVEDSQRIAYDDLRKLGFTREAALRDSRAAADETAKILDKQHAGSGVHSTTTTTKPNPRRVPWPWEKDQGGV